jgi:hypothetical protein
MKKAILLLCLSAALLVAGCAKNPGSETANTNAAPYQAPEPVNQEDGSNITTASAPNGIKSEVRSFPQGVLIQISRATWPDGRQAATVRFRDGRAVDLKEPADIEQSMTASGETMAAIALRTAGFPDSPATPANGNKTNAAKADKKGSN